MRLGLFLSLCWLGAAAIAIAQGSVTAVSASKIYVGNGEVIENGVILAKGGKIVAIGPRSKVEIPRGTRILRARGGTITPGLIDAAAATVLGAGKAEQGSEVTPQSQVIDGLDMHSKLMSRLAREGVTTVFVSPGSEAVISGQGATVKTGRALTGRVLDGTGSPKLVLVAGPERGNSRPRSPATITKFTRLPLGRMGGVFVARAALGQAKDWAKARSAGDKPEPNEAYEVLADIMAKKMPMRVQARRQNEVATASRLAKEFGFEYVIVEGVESYRNVSQLKRDKATVIYGPVKRPPTPRVDPRFRRFFSDPYEHHQLATAKKLTDAGVRLALTSGGRTGEDGLARQGSFAMRYGMSRAQVLAAVTSTPAKVLGVDKRVGTLEIGKDADLIVWSGEPFDATSGVRHVIINGQRVSGEAF